MKPRLREAGGRLGAIRPGVKVQCSYLVDLELLKLLQLLLKPRLGLAHDLPAHGVQGALPAKVG